jgi:hypothetical protein
MGIRNNCERNAKSQLYSLTRANDVTKYSKRETAPAKTNVLDSPIISESPSEEMPLIINLTPSDQIVKKEVRISFLSI